MERLLFLMLVQVDNFVFFVYPPVCCLDFVDFDPELLKHEEFLLEVTRWE